MRKLLKCALLCLAMSFFLTSCSLIPALRPKPSENIDSISLPEVPQTEVEKQAYNIRQTLEQMIYDNGFLSRRAVLNVLLDAGFVDDNIQVTSDRTPVMGQRPEAIDFGVLALGECIVGSVRSNEVAIFVTDKVQSIESCLLGSLPPN